MGDENYQILEHREQISEQLLMQEFADAKAPLGTRLALADGRTFRYCKAGAVALAAGKVVSTPIDGLEREDTISAASAIGSRIITYEAVATMTENEYRDGLACIVDGTGQGLQYKIKNHLAITAGDTGAINLYDKIVTALDTTTDVMLIKSIYDALVLTPDQVVLPIGVPNIPVTALFYFWAQTWGIAPVLAEDSTGDAATERICTLGTIGGVKTTAGGAPGTPIIGRVLPYSEDHVSGDYPPIFLTISP